MGIIKQSKRHNELNGKRILAIDYGTKVTGLAIFTPGKEPYPTPFDKIIYKNDPQLAKDIIQICHNELIEVFVLGIPRLLDGTETNMTKQVQKFGQTILPLLTIEGIEYFEQDESLSTFEAKERMKNSPLYNFQVDPKKIDALAASIILEDFMRDEI